ncbi:MAG: CAP domain-containing protein, partial [Chloroflexota bacterium]
MRQALSPVTARRVCEALRSIGIALAGMSLAALVFACAISGAAPVPTVATVAAAGLDVAMAEVQFLDLLNADRVANGLPPMEPDPRLMELARWRSED